ncbi:hypothetical protein KBT16_11905, partial [Nostoc sp. CCCryo 231-06]|nr:hypothetical protein [Nostoc sp. CCCryo 231-06]
QEIFLNINVLHLEVRNVGSNYQRRTTVLSAIQIHERVHLVKQIVSGFFHSSLINYEIVETRNFASLHPSFLC